MPGGSVLGRLGIGRAAIETIIAMVKAALLDMELSISIYADRSQAAQNQLVDALGRSLSRLAEGDLTAEITEDFGHGYAGVKSDYNRALAELRGLIGSVQQGMAAIQNTSAGFGKASEELARRTESSAASLEETSAAINQMDGRLRDTASEAGNILQQADVSMEAVAQGRETAGTAKAAMNRVSESARGIDGVIEGLDKIAFQTRVLAMNAAVEAGRAGEAGRGFAVVADLVSALAMRAEEEAGRAREELSTTQADIASAVEMVKRVDGSLSEISQSVGAVHGLLGKIASDNESQSRALSEIRAAMEDMDKSTQKNAAMVEESAAAGRSLVSEISLLTGEAARFTIGRDGANDAPAQMAALGD